MDDPQINARTPSHDDAYAHALERFFVYPTPCRLWAVLKAWAAL